MDGATAQNEEQRQVLEKKLSPATCRLAGRCLTAPDVPADRVKALRQAFDETMRDPQFIEAAKQANMEINPMSGEELQRVVERIVTPSPGVLAMVKKAIAIKDVERKSQ